MRYSFAAIVGLVAVQQAAACDTCWQNPEPFPAGPDNCDECPEELKGRGGVVDWSQAPSGSPNYLGIKGSDCEVGSGNGKRDFILRGRTFGGNGGSSDSGNSITGKCARGQVTQNSGPSFSHQSPLSMKQLNLACSHETDMQFNFHYDSGPYKGKTCSHTASLKPGDNSVDISQCGGANRVTCNIPSNTQKPPPQNCELGFKSLHFDCRQCPPKTPPKSSAPPPASTPPASKPPSSQSSAPPGTGRPPPSSSLPGTSPPPSSAPPQSSSPPPSSTPETHPPSSTPPSSSAPPATSPPASSAPPETKPPTTSLPPSSFPPIRNSTSTPPAPPASSSAPPPASSSPAPPASSSPAPPASSAPPSSSSPGSPPASPPASTAPPSQTSPNSPQTPPYQTSSPPGVASSAPPGTTVPVVTTEIIETTITTCPYTSTHSTSGTTSVETGMTTSTVTLTRTETVCTYCVQPPPQTSAPAPPTQPSSPPQSQQPQSSQTPNSPVQPPQPPNVAPAPPVLPSCLQTWMTLTQCKSVTDTDCFCKNADFTSKVQDCVSAWAQGSDELAGAVRYLAGICAKQIPQNPGLVTNVPTTITLAPVPATSSPNSPVQPSQPGKSAPASVPAGSTPAPAPTPAPQGSPAAPPAQVVKIDTQVTVTIPCSSGAAGGAAPVTQIADGQVQAPAASVCTTTSRISKDVTVPQVAFNTNPAGVGLVEGTAPAQTSAVSPAKTSPASPAGAKPAGTGVPISPTTAAPITYTGSDATKTRSSTIMLTVLLAAVGLAVFA